MNRLKKFNKTAFLWMIMVVFFGVSVRASDTDARIETSLKNSAGVKTELKDDDIQFSSKKGIVTLKGTVTTKNDKIIAENIAGEVPGVDRVDNQLKVKTP